VRILSIITAAIVAAIVTVQPADAKADPRDGTVLVFGDSTTMQYTDDPGDPQQGWWSRLAAVRNLEPVISAQFGGGLIKKGNGCEGTAVRERSTAVINRVRPDEIWFALGRNDTDVCVKGRKTPISPTFRNKATTAYFAQLAALADTNGIPRTSIYVTTIWGTKDITLRHDVVTTFATAAKAVGITYINTPRLPLTHTRDATHPNTTGNAYVAELLGSKMRPRVVGEPTAP
jgi:lysophospholipase L1-like esterase